jgi:Leucine-rich repeat (LRR) protein
VELNLDLSAFAQLEVIESLPHLRTLSLARCPIARAKWAYLALARNLRELNVAHTSFTDCTVLSGPDLHGLAPMPSNDDVSTTASSGRPLANDGNEEEQGAPATMATARIVVTEAYDHSTDEGDDNDNDNDGARAVATASQQQREALTGLERLDLDGCHVHEKGMCGLKYLASLKYLSIRQVTHSTFFYHQPPTIRVIFILIFDSDHS